MRFDSKIFVIAEAGVNHNGKLAKAKELVDRAREAGADAVKFQTFRARLLATGKAPVAAYQRRNGTGAAKNQADLLARLELSFRDFRFLKEYCDMRKITFLSTPFDEESADFLDSLGVPLFKISSGDLTDLPFLAHVARKRKPVILSTGMSELDEVRRAVDALHAAGNKQLTLLHCVTEYPAPFEEVNLKAMDTLAREFRVPVGYSDHTLGFEIALAAAARGAAVIEKHFTLDRRLEGPDHAVSLSPRELADMVRAIRNIEKAMGDGVKRPTKSEEPNRRIVRKSVVAARDFAKGETITREGVILKRPGDGIPPGDLGKVLGLRARLFIKRDTVLSWKHLDAPKENLRRHRIAC
jgi:N-acetylneuraminate synthase